MEAGAPARYVAIITDGNGRWAKQRGVPVVRGHEAGADTVKARLRDAAELGIEELTVFSFSTENWSRPAEEVAGLMAMFDERIRVETPELDAEGVRVLLRDVFIAAGGTHDDWAAYDAVMAQEGRAAVLLTAERLYSNPAAG